MRPPETEFERGTRQFALLIMRTVFFLVLFVLLAGALLHHAFLESLLFAVRSWGAAPAQDASAWFSTAAIRMPSSTIHGRR